MTHPRANIPDRMKHLAVDARGYAVPFGVVRDADGLPHFGVNDEYERQRSIRRDLCSVCGKENLRGRWFVGGPRSAFDPQGAYIDMPMHDECAHYALRVCPYLAAPRYTGEIAGKKFAAARTEDVVMTVDPTTIPGRPPLFVAVMAVGQRMTGGPLDHQNYVVPARPYRKIEFWCHGGRVDETEGWARAADECGYPVPTLHRLSQSRNAA
jgi:hypothetical protein